MPRRGQPPPRRLGRPARSAASLPAAASRAATLATFTALLLLHDTTSLGAQSHGAVAGTITSPDSSALAFAHVAVPGSRLSFMTGRDGRFHFPELPPGAVLLEVSLLGYESVSRSVQVLAGRTVTVQIALQLEPIPLDAIEGSVASLRTPEMRGFYDRRERGRGHFFTIDDIERMQPRLLTDILRRVPGMRVEPLSGPAGATDVVRTQRTAGITGNRHCPVLYYVNGMPFPLAADMGINTYIRPADVAGVEVYSGASQLPPQFHLSQGNARCGLVVIWTRSGEKRPGS
jgi:hypothetical protein